MKQKIFDALKTKFAGVKDEILDRIAAKAAKTVTTDEELATYIEGVTIQTIIDAYGDSRATDAQKTAVANYEKKHNIKDGKPVEKEPEPKPKEPEPQGDVPAWAQAIIDSNKAMREQLDAIKGEKVTNTRKAQFDEILKDCPEKLKARCLKDFERQNFKDDDEFSGWLAEYKTDIENITADITAKGGIVTRPKQGNAGSLPQVNAALKAQVDANKAAQAAGGAVILGLPTTV